ncbi:tetraacyldisaccharide 4'-kinase [compost metagenome]
MLDDAFQHRKVKAGLYVLLTAYGDLYADDFILPAGNLRESRNGAERAKIIVVTKCPPDLSAKEQDRIQKKLKIDSDQKLCFTSIAYDEFVFSEERQLSVSEIKPVDKLLLAGIAKPEPFFAYLQSENDVILTFPDHHHFTEKDIVEIKNKAQDKKIITTEKDFVRLRGRLPDSQLFYLPIKSHFISGGNDFDKTILNYVGKSSRNS